jgi:hypothetical protein
MRYFQKIKSDLNTASLLNAVIRQPDLWNQFNVRTRNWNAEEDADCGNAPRTPHRQVDDILIRFNDLKQDINAIANDKECINFPAAYRLPQARALIFGLMSLVEGEQLGRVLITKLRPGATIAPHVDMGSPAEFYDRFHIVLNSAPGCLFRSGDETVYMQTGDVWWFDNRAQHEVINNSADDRIHLIIDIRTFK